MRNLKKAVQRLYDNASACLTGGQQGYVKAYLLSNDGVHELLRACPALRGALVALLGGYRNPDTPEYEGPTELDGDAWRLGRAIQYQGLSSEPGPT